LIVYKPGYEFLQQDLTFSDSITGQLLTLRRDDGIEVRAHDRESGAALRLLFVSEAGVAKPGALARMTIRLDQDGVGRLPTAVSDAPLMLWATGYRPITLAGGSGQPIELLFAKDDQF
jgi:hypothetical protein